MSNDAPTPESGRVPNKGKLAKDLNEVIRYTLWSVFKLKDVLPEDRTGYADEVQELFDQLAAKDVTIRGTYDVSGLRADADVMIWWHAETSDQLQEAYNLFRRTKLGLHLPREIIERVDIYVRERVLQSSLTESNDRAA